MTCHYEQFCDICDCDVCDRLTGNTSSSVYSACQKVDTGEVIGTGVNHILTPSHKEMRKEVFAHLHDNLIDYLPKEDELESLE